MSKYKSLKDGDLVSAMLDDVDPHPKGNVRRKRNKEAYSRLRQSIQRGGVIQSVVVRLNPSDETRLQLLAGYGRFQASSELGLQTIPAIFKAVDDKEALTIMLSENTHREKLSISDEIKASQRYVSFFDGDYEAASKELGWPINKLRKRLELNKCSFDVLDALFEKKIAVGHAEILSGYLETVQNSTLNNIINNEWTVEELKERAGRRTRGIKSAIFDTTDCLGCPHNSGDAQAELFDNTVGKSKCCNLSCYTEKTNEALSAKKTVLLEKYSQVFLEVEKPAEDRNTVCPKTVGKDQYSVGCSGCENNSAVIQDGINEDAGKVVEDQCVYLECFTKMTQEHQKKNSPKKTTSESKKKSAAKKSETTPAKKKTTQATPKSAIAQSNALLHKISASHFKQDEHFNEALLVASLSTKITSSKLKAIEKVWSAPTSFNDRVIDLYNFSAELLGSVKNALYLLYINEGGNLSSEVETLMVKMLANDKQWSDLAIEGWTPTQEILNSYLMGGLKKIATQSGFKKHFDAANGDGSFNKVSGRKSDLVKAMLDTEFDWTSYAPDDYLDLLTNSKS